MKKLLLLGALMATSAMQAQTTYYWPVQRAEVLTNNTQYFIYNTSYNPSSNDNAKDRTNFLYANGSNLGTTKALPSSFVTNEAKYLFTLEKPATPTSDNHWYIKTTDGYVSIEGSTVNPAGKDLYITNWATNSNISKASGIQSQKEDESGFVDPNSESTEKNKIWTITSTEDASPNPNGDIDYGWNGDANSWAIWGNAHPYAFYTIEKKELTQESDEAYKALLGLCGDAYNLHLSIGLIKNANQLSTNAQEQSEGPIKNLIDHKDNTFFHSSWQNDPTPDGTAHYIQVSLNEPVTSFVFYSKRRMDTTNDRPTNIKISVSMDGVEFKEIKTLTEADGLIAANDYTSPIISSDSEFKYVRFEVLKTNSGNEYFSYSEFYLFDAAQYEKIAAVKNYELLKTETAENIKNTCTELYNTIKRAVLSNEIQTNLSTIKSFNWGTGLNQLIQPENYDQTVANAEAITNESSIEEMETSKDALEQILTTLTINQPETGKFYRIKSVLKNKYVTSNQVAGEQQRLTESGTDNTTVFYLSADNHLTCSTLCNMSLQASTASNLGTTYEFLTNNNGYYMIKATDIETPLYAHNDPKKGDVLTYDFNGGAYADRLANAWTLEEVTDAAQQFSLKKEMTAEYATLAAPVALKIPAGVKAYTVTVDATDAENAKAILTEITDVIPAGVAVVLKKAGTENSFEFILNPEGTTENENALVGVYASTNVDTNTNAYVLGNGTKGLGFYQMDGTDRTLAANKAYLVLSQEAKGIRSIIFSDGTTTGIESTVAEGAEAEEYYDLQGRRVMNPTKGIYVTKSGKKVVINK